MLEAHPAHRRDSAMRVQTRRFCPLPSEAARLPPPSMTGPVAERVLGSGPAYSRYSKQIAKAVGLPRP